MNIAAYDNKIRALYEEHRTLVQRADPRTGRVARRLLRIAQEKQDDALAGYAAHSAAFAAHFIEGSHASFIRYLRLSATHLLRADDRTELVHVYYLVAIDAMGKGMHDISCHYFLIARNLALETGQETYAAILDLNIGNILIRTKRPKDARVFFKRCRRGISKDKTHPHHHANLISCHLNDGAACLALNRFAEAEKNAEQAAALIARTPADMLFETQFCLALLEARLALVRGDDARLAGSLSAMYAHAAEVTDIAAYLPDLRHLLSMLLEDDRNREAKRLLEKIEACGIAPRDSMAQLVFASMRIEYLEAAGSKQALLAACTEQDRIYTRFLKERKEVYVYVKDLIRLVDSLQREQTRVREEHEELSVLAEQDVLTSLANRYALNNRLEASFEQMYQQQLPLGICLIDLDDLKTYNDRYGHREGDELLRRFSGSLQQISSTYGLFAARYGGDEFVLIGENKTPAHFRDAVKALRKATGVQFSHGVCNRIPDDKSRPWDFFMQADKALYRTKRNKRL